MPSRDPRHFAVRGDVERMPLSFGGTLLILFGVQVITGILLAMRYVPTAEGAAASVRLITEGVPFGWLVRGMHRMAATLMVIAALLHLARTFLCAEFTSPREWTWVAGVLLLALTLLFGFSGSALVGDPHALAATRVGLGLAGPLGSLAGRGSEILPRLYTLHIVILPVATILLVVFHIARVRRYAPDPNEPDTVPYAPDHLLSQTLVGLLAVMLALGLAILLPVPAPGTTSVLEATSASGHQGSSLGGASGALIHPGSLRPEWYFLPAYAVLRVLPKPLAPWCMVAAFFFLMAWPWIERCLSRMGQPRAALAAIRAVVLFGPLALALVEALT